MNDTLTDQRIANLVSKLDDAVWCIADLKRENNELRRFKAAALTLTTEASVQLAMSKEKT